MKYQPPNSHDIVDSKMQATSLSKSFDNLSAPYVHYTGSSMYPTFHDPEFLLIEQPDIKTLRVGDIIIFKTPQIDSLVIHRIIKVCDNFFLTKGDNNRYADAVPVPRDSIQGRASGVLGRKGVKPVLNGYKGLVLTRLNRLCIVFKRCFIKPIVTHLFAGSARKSIGKPCLIKPEFCVFKRIDGSEHIRLIWNKRTVGYLNNATGQVFIKRLYRPFISNAYLENKLRLFSVVRNVKRNSPEQTALESDPQ